MRYISHVASFLVLVSLIITLEVPQAQAQTSPTIIISEVKIGEKNAASNEFIELYNRTNQTIDISGWKLQKKTSTGSLSAIASIDTCVFLPPQKHFLWANAAAIPFSSLADKTTTASLAINNTFEMINRDGGLEDTLLWDVNAHDTESATRNPETLAWNFTTVLSPTGHGAICQKTLPQTPEPSTETLSSPSSDAGGTSTVRINEVLPNPSDTDEFIELFNFGTTDIDLRNWSLHDASKTGRYTFKNTTILRAQSYLTLFRDTLSFALNNTHETVTLLDPHGSTIDTIGYAKSNKDISYNFSQTGWRFSDIITPDALNQFTTPPLSQTILPKHIYKDTPTHFEAKTSDTDTKYTWNFGDGHTSHLASAVHTFTKTGAKTITLLTTNTIEDIIETFTINVQKLPKIKLVITGIIPNPSGVDTGHEWIMIKNLSKKKVDLLDWSIGSGSTTKTLANHPIRESFIIKSGQVATLTSDISAFSLPNKAGIIELRQPNKQAVDTIQYAQAAGIEEGAQYQKAPDNTWGWIYNAPNSVTTEATLPILESAPLDDGQLQNSLTTPAILNLIDTLSVDELTLLKTHIEETLQLAEITRAAEETPATYQTPPSLADENAYHKQSLLGSPQDTLLSRIKHAPPLQKTLIGATEGASLPDQASLKTQSETRKNTQALQRLNQSVNAFLRGL